MNTQAPRGYLARQFGEALVAKREAAGLSQRAQAKALGIAGNTLRELELGLANPTVGRLEQIAAAMDIDLSLFVDPEATDA
jgi:transcriptional regulator with XRE-family HTH domain